MSLRYLIRKVLIEQTEEEVVRIDPEEYKQLLKYVNGDGSALKKLKQYRGKKIIIDGDLNIGEKDGVTNIDSIDYVDGNLDITYSDISYFDKSKVKGRFNYFYSKMYKIEREKILQKKKEYQNELRQQDEWNIENNDEVSNQTQALFNHLVSEEIVKEGEDKYNIYKENYQHYGKGGVYTWLGEDEFESEWVVYNNDDIHDAAKENLENLVDELGIDAFRLWVWENHIDEDAARRYLYDDYEYLVREEPEDYNISKELTQEQEKTINVFKQKISNLQKKLTDTSLSQDEIDNINRQIEGAKNIIEDIEENPEGDYDEDEIESAIDSLVDDNVDNILDILKGRGFEAQALIDFVDIDGAIEYVIRSDGYGQILNGYDGKDDEYKINGIWYHVMRHN
jgi:hypothetical protein